MIQNMTFICEVSHSSTHCICIFSTESISAAFPQCVSHCKLTYASTFPLQTVLLLGIADIWNTILTVYLLHRLEYSRTTEWHIVKKIKIVILEHLDPSVTAERWQ